ncbi:Panacea domain-containing protein [Comamonas terrigena]|uniref:Panacea domain-containing protein n=1 Tax=Comamonas terrigena TaxID=32013 RepID=UPI00289F0AEC|nr:Panacea domain-containing protein [Comamonas terrigena]
MNLEKLIIYICQNYPHPRELSKARLTKIVYLADWKSCQKNGHQLTDIVWYFDNFGPYVDDIVNEARLSGSLRVELEKNIYGNTKERISLSSDIEKIKINEIYAEIVDEVIEETRDLYWEDFIRYVYRTEPIRTSERYSTLNLEKISRRSRNNDNW